MPPEQIDEFLDLFNMNAALSETLLIDESSVKITVTSLTYIAYSVDLQLTIQNNSGTTLTRGFNEGCWNSLLPCLSASLSPCSIAKKSMFSGSNPLKACIVISSLYQRIRPQIL